LHCQSTINGPAANHLYSSVRRRGRPIDHSSSTRETQPFGITCGSDANGVAQTDAAHALNCTIRLIGGVLDVLSPTRNFAEFSPAQNRRDSTELNANRTTCPNSREIRHVNPLPRKISLNPLVLSNLPLPRLCV
jgi:hypothetical protein